jgi:hypothetical protein
MSNYIQPDFRVPTSSASVIPVNYNPLQIGSTPTGFMEQVDFRVPPTKKGVGDWPIYLNALMVGFTGNYIQPKGKDK